MKKNIFALLMTILFANSAIAYDCPIGVDDNTILDGLEIVSTEINSYNHSDKAMKKAFRKLCRIEKILKKDRGANCRDLPASITDADLLTFIDDIATEIQNNDHRERKMFLTSIKLNRLNRLLIKRRTSPQVDDIAVLEISGSDPFDFGFVTIGLTAPVTFTVTNTGNADATAISTAVLGSFSVNGGTCTTLVSLAPAATCTLDVNFSPLGAGSEIQTLELGYYNNVENDLTTKELQGTGF